MTRRGTAWWSRTRGLPADAYAGWMAAQGGGSTRILAWATTPDGYAVGGPETLSHGNGADWQTVGWHQIERGGWNAELGQLTWTELAAPGESGRRGAVELVDAGRLPELFRERVAATIAVERFVPLSGSRGVVVTARRHLGPDRALSWHGSLTGGLSWSADGVPEAVERAIAELRREYDRG